MITLAVLFTIDVLDMIIFGLAAVFGLAALIKHLLGGGK